MSGTSWSAVRDSARDALRDAGVESPEIEARWVVEQVSGYHAAEFFEIERSAPPDRQRELVAQLVARRAAGEPLQYVLGSWSFRGIELMVDRRVLIPRPETEWVVEIALREARRIGLRLAPSALRTEPRGADRHIADLGTGSGAIAIALAQELCDVTAWAGDASEDALAVAAANVAGCGARGVRVVHGEWFDAVPGKLRGELALVVTNPPYVSSGEFESLPPVVRDYEPVSALVSGPTGLEALEHVIGAASDWLAPEGALVCEIAPQRANATAELARAAGFAFVAVQDDLAGRPRVLVARAQQ